MPLCQVTTPPYSHVTLVSDTQGSDLIWCGCYSVLLRCATPDILTHLVNIIIMRVFMLLCLLFSFFISALADVTTMTDKILKDILKDYNPKARPAGNLSDRYDCPCPTSNQDAVLTNLLTEIIFFSEEWLLALTSFLFI